MKQLSPSTRGHKEETEEEEGTKAERREREAAVIIRGVQLRDDQRDLSV